MTVLLMLLGAGLVYIALQYLYKKRWSKNLTVDVKFNDKYAYVGSETVITETITNKKALPLAYVNLKFKIDKSFDFGNEDSNSAVSDNTYRNDIFALLYYQRVTRKVPVKCTKRGVYMIDTIDIVSSGVFMNDVLVAQYPENTGITVYPKQADVDRLNIPFSKVMGTLERNRHIYEDNFMFRGIRQYETFDSMDRINWKASARAGTLMVNQYNESVSQQVCILLNLEPDGMIRYDKLSEEGISITSGLSRLLIEQGISVSLYCNGCDYETKAPIQVVSDRGLAQFNNINTALARIDLDIEMQEFSENILNVINSESKTENNMLYILISASRRKALQLNMQGLSRTYECMWIMPFHAGMDTTLSYCNINTTEWEVER